MRTGIMAWIINDGELAIPRISLIYYGEDWIFTDTVIIKDDEKRFTFEVDAATDTYNGKVFEGMELVLGENGIQLLEQIEKEYERKVEEYKDETDMDVKELLTNYFILDGRLSGSSGDRDFSFVVNSASKIIEFYNDFVEAGGLEQDLSVVEGEFPCTVKEM